ncbi:MAG: hypothetical protein BGO57_08905 [Sphingomonadales bacterium 63-6]|nr:MAG: hypothetical protein BGO57_08905 [Sphingomonadales bacterium 63-6]
MNVRGIAAVTLIFISAPLAAAGDDPSDKLECAAHYQLISALMEMSSSSKNRNADPVDLAKTERSMVAYRERAKELMVKAGRMVAVDTDLPKDVLDREEALFSSLMKGEINMDAVVRGVTKCNRDYGFQDIP